MPGEVEQLLNDPRIAGFAQRVAQHVAASTAQILTQAVQQIAQSVGPSGRPVEVTRRNEQNLPFRQTTTTPQLLAELNDNLVDLMDSLDEANELTRVVVQAQQNVAPKRKRRRRSLVD